MKFNFIFKMEAKIGAYALAFDGPGIGRFFTLPMVFVDALFHEAGVQRGVDSPFTASTTSCRNGQQEA